MITIHIIIIYTFIGRISLFFFDLFDRLVSNKRALTIIFLFYIWNS